MPPSGGPLPQIENRGGQTSQPVLPGGQSWLDLVIFPLTGSWGTASGRHVDKQVVQSFILCLLEEKTGHSGASGPHSTAISLPVPRTTHGQKQSHFREGNRDSGTEESPVHGCDHASLHSKIPWHQDEERYAKVQHGVCVPTWHFWGPKVTGKVIVRQGEADDKVVTSSGWGGYH